MIRTRWSAMIAAAVGVAAPAIGAEMKQAAPLPGGQMPGGQMVAFPGAEGAGRHATGGRGGDVYHVTNLNDSGVGSLRHAVESSNGPRTIVFDVGGIIELESEIRARNFNGLTIAGQTAPGGGITIANASFWVRDSQNVILQHLRFASGDAVEENARSLRLWDVHDAIVDHVTGRWGSEDNLSVSTCSDRVTVQYSFITEGLHHADHAKGERGYGSVINGGQISYINNLYAHNRSRNPRVGVRPDQDGDTFLEFSNNVLYHARDLYAGLSETVRLNYVNNLAINGPNSGGTPSAMVQGAPTTSVYHSGNLYDRDLSRLVDLDGPSGPIVSGPAVVNQPFDISDYQARSLRQTYIDVLSHAGASYARDHHDHRVIRDVMQRGGVLIDRPSDVGGYGTVDPGAPVVSTARDGIADWWKEAHGLDVNQQYHPVDSGDGYTWLEKYLHSLSRPHRPASDTVQFQVMTAYGRGADAQVSENNGESGGSGTSPAINARWTGPDGDRNEYILLRFDVGHVQPGSFRDAGLELVSYRDMGEGHTLRVYGLDHHVANQAWNEGAIEFANGPGLAFDGNSGTRGRIDEDVVLLGTFQTGGKTEGESILFDHPNLAVFLNLLAYNGREEGEDGLVTLLIERETASGGQSRFASKEATSLESGEGSFRPGTFAPRLVLDGALKRIPGDVNGDGRVDIADLGVLAANWQQGGRSWAEGDFTGDGWVDVADLGVVAANWQSGEGGMSFEEAVAMFDVFEGAVVPEPAALGLLGSGLLLRRSPGALSDASLPVSERGSDE